MTHAGRKGNGSPDEPGHVKVTVVDRRHHARPSHEDAASPRDPQRYPSFVEELKARAEQAEKRAREAMLEAHAEIDSVRERLRRDIERRVKEGKTRILGSLLEVADNLDRAAKAAGAESRIVADGLELIRQQILTILRTEGVEPIETIGLEYDPNVAEAVTVETVDVERDNLVLEEVQRGYRYGESVLRPARVKVGKTGSESPVRTPPED